MKDVKLAVTIHDPEERHLALLRSSLPDLTSWYSGMAAACSPETSSRTIETLREAGFVTTYATGGRIGDARRRSLELLTRSAERHPIHYIDLDRLLHWHQSFGEELFSLLVEPHEHEYMALGRTDRALRTHPRVQVKAELLTNHAFSAITGVPLMDLVAGSCMVSRNAAELIVDKSTEPTNATDLEWPAIVMRRLHASPEFRAVEGLEFETCDFYEREIALAGSREAWIHQVYDQPGVWRSRAQLALDSIAALERVWTS